MGDPRKMAQEQNEQNPLDNLEWWRKQGYLAGRELFPQQPQIGLWMVVMPMVFTYRVAVCSKSIVMEFYCYEGLAQAMECFDKWDGGPNNPVREWSRHHA